MAGTEGELFFIPEVARNSHISTRGYPITGLNLCVGYHEDIVDGPQLVFQGVDASHPQGSGGGGGRKSVDDAYRSVVKL